MTVFFGLAASAASADLDRQIIDMKRTGDLIQFGCAIAFVLVPLGAGWAIGRFTALRRRLGIPLAPLLLPLVIAGLCIWIMVSASLATAEQCGVDACGMAMAAALAVLGVDAVGYVIGILIALFSFEFGRRARIRALDGVTP